MGGFLKVSDFLWVILLLASTGGNSVKPKGITLADLQGKEWKLTAVKTPAGDTGLSRQSLEADDMGDFYTLQFDSERISGKAAPNRYTAPYRQEGERGISFSPMASTRMASFKEPEGLREQEYYDYLGQVSRWDVVERTLELYTRDTEGQDAVLVFETD